MHTIQTPEEQLFRPATTLSLLTNSTRRQMLEVLRREGPLEILVLADRLGISNLKLHNHLSLLAEAGLVHVRQIGEQRVAKFRPIGWARLKYRWERGIGSIRTMIAATE